jgi:hypothetical protein
MLSVSDLLSLEVVCFRSGVLKYEKKIMNCILVHVFVADGSIV